MYAIGELKKASLPIEELTRSIALSLQNKDLDTEAIYGLEIQSNGSSRSSRIPIVRVSNGISTIWKVIKRLEDVDKGVATLNKLVYFLGETGSGVVIPRKVLVVIDDENRYGKNELRNNKYVNQVVQKEELIWFSLDFLFYLLRKGGRVDFNKLLSRSGAIFTTIPI